MAMPDGGSASIQDLLSQLISQLQQYGIGTGGNATSTSTPGTPSSEQSWFAPAHIFDKSPVTATAPNPKTPRAVPQGAPASSFRDTFANAAMNGGANANFGEGGGPGGIAAASNIRAGSGYAPATLAGMMAAAGNIGRIAAAPINPMGLAGLGMQASGTTPSGILGHLFGGINTVPGQTPFDADLRNKLSANYTTADMVRDQEARNAARGGGGIDSGGGHIGSSGTESHGQVRGGGTGSAGGGLTAGGPR